MWYHNNMEIENQTTNTFQILSGDRSNIGNYSCKVVTENNLQKSSDEKKITFLCKYLYIELLI